MVDFGALFSDLITAETRMWNAVDRRLHADHGLELGQYEVLRIIGSTPDCRVYDIAVDLDVTVGAASKAVDRLQALRWCRRRPNAADRRSSLVLLTANGRRVLEAAEPTVRDEVASILGKIASRTALEHTAQTLAAVRTAVSRHAK